MSDTTMQPARARQNPHEIAKNAAQWRVLINAIRRQSGDRAAASLLAYEAGRINDAMKAEAKPQIRPHKALEAVQ